MDLDDLLQAGSIGLLKATTSYDIDNKYNASFFTYSYYSIRAEILTHQNKHREMISVPRKKKDENKYSFT